MTYYKAVFSKIHLSQKLQFPFSKCMSPMQKVRKAVGYIINTLQNTRFSRHYAMTLVRNIMLVINFFYVYLQGIWNKQLLWGPEKRKEKRLSVVKRWSIVIASFEARLSGWIKTDTNDQSSPIEFACAAWKKRASFIWKHKVLNGCDILLVRIEAFNMAEGIVNL